MEIFNIVAPIFTLVFSGYFLRRVNLVKIHWIHTLNSFVYYVSLPALVLVSFWQIDFRAKEVWQTSLFNLLFVGVFSLLVLCGLYFVKLPKKLKAALFLVSVVGNTIYMGFPLAGSAFGPEALPVVVATATAHLVFGTVFGILGIEFLVLKPQKPAVYLKHFLHNPLISSLLAGLLLSVVNLNAPVFDLIKKPLSILGGTASPVALFSLGAFMFGKFSYKHLGLSFFASALKLGVLPVFLGITTFLFFKGTVSVPVSVVLAGMPTAVTCFVLAEEYRLEEEFVGSTILISTVISLVSVSLLLFFTT